MATENQYMARVWQFEDAPPEYKAVSDIEDDETWLICLPLGADPRIGDRLAEKLAVCNFTRYITDDGFIIWITT